MYHEYHTQPGSSFDERSRKVAQESWAWSQERRRRIAEAKRQAWEEMMVQAHQHKSPPLFPALAPDTPVMQRMAHVARQIQGKLSIFHFRLQIGRLTVELSRAEGMAGK